MFYLKVAVRNIRQSFHVFAPFILASLVLFTIVSSLFGLALSPVVQAMGSGGLTIGLGIFVMAIFSTILEIYSYRFLMQQRTREFGLYNILGMNKKQVGLVASLELFLIFIILLVLGSALGMVFSNVFYLLFVNLVGYAELHFSMNPLALILTSLQFAGIFFILELIALVKVGTSSPLVLFRSQEKGEREPKGNLFLALLGILSLGVGYYLSLSSQANGVAIITRFFIAVLFVIAGTYLFFVSFLTWYLKQRRKNKKYFYTPEHFITTSQMIFRMKQHAVGLANITLLAVMSFVTIATTVSLYTGMYDLTDQAFPKNTSLTYTVNNREEGQEKFQESVLTVFPEKEESSINYLSFLTAMIYDGGNSIQITQNNIHQPDFNHLIFVHVITQDDFRKLGNQIPQLSERQIAYWSADHKHYPQKVHMEQNTFEVLPIGENIQYPNLSDSVNTSVMVVADNQQLNQIVLAYQSQDDKGYLVQLDYHVYADFSDQEIDQLAESTEDFVNPLLDKNGESIGTLVRKENFEQLYLGFTGGFLFTGFLLGISFLLGAALIIYYKQYSEGHEDKKSYKILQEVGMSPQAVKKTIGSQTLLVFFLPLALAILHFLISLVMLHQMLAIFNVESHVLIYGVSAITILVIVAFYFMVYKWTSRTYYRIIEH